MTGVPSNVVVSFISFYRIMAHRTFSVSKNTAFQSHFIADLRIVFEL